MDTATQPDDGIRNAAARSTQKALALVIVWSSHEPERVGELTVVPVPSGQLRVFGRGVERNGDLRPRAVVLTRSRPPDRFNHLRSPATRP